MNLQDDLPEHLLRQLEAYYDGTLDATELARLKQQLRQDPDLATLAAEWESVYRHGLLAEAGGAKERERLRRVLAEEEARHPPITARQRKLGTKWWLLAASFALLLVAAYWLIARPSPAERLAQERFAWLPRQEATLGPAEDAQRGLLAYDRQQYAAAYPLLRDGVADGVLDSVNLLYAGVAALGAGEAATARELLTSLLATERYPLEEDNLRYYLALTALELGDIPAARDYLQRGGAGPRVEALREEVELLQ